MSVKFPYINVEIERAKDQAAEKLVQQTMIILEEQINESKK
jgi:hypothetical protein